MQREILFRGQTIGGDWVEGLLSIVKGTKGINNASPGYFISNKSGMPLAFQIRPETLGQYTGLKDRNGAKIFEGDAVKFYIGELGYVLFREGAFKFRSPINTGALSEYSNIRDWMTRFEIIGNIHDNPELLTPSQESK